MKNQQAVRPANRSFQARHALALSSVLVALGLLSACGGDDGPSDFCHRLAGSSDCDNTAEASCHSAISQQNKDTPQCQSALQQLLDCAAKLPRVGCSGSASAYATGDGQFSGNNFTEVGGAHVVVADSSCTSAKQAYDKCIG